jgi:flagellar biosynthesis/type III secretory pathway protein FliH
LSKKIILLLLSLILTVTAVPSVTAAGITIQDLQAHIDVERREAAISGQITSGEGKYVTVQVHDPNGELEYLNQTVSGPSGSFEFNYGLREHAISGTYIVYLSGAGATPQQITYELGDIDPTPTPTPTPTPVPQEDDDDEEDTTVEEDDGDAEIVNNPKEEAGRVVVELPNGKTRVLLPPNAQALNGRKLLHIVGEDATAEIPGEVLEALKRLVSAEELEGAHISLAMQEVSDKDAMELLNKINGQLSAKITTAGDVINFHFSLITKDGKSKELTQFERPIKIHLKIKENANSDLLGIYFIADDGTLEYVGGEIIGDFITAEVEHFSNYAVLEYHKTFADVDEQHWAYDAIRRMAAKHIVVGVSESRFAPEQQVTRAEFTALIARALQLEVPGKSNFSDVEPSAWYAEAIAAAYEYGIVSGRSSNTFAPNSPITREEMAVMIMRAYERKIGKAYVSSSSAEFSDAKHISAWAKNSIQSAVELGFVQGRNDGFLEPNGQATRAETAQIISRLTQALQSKVSL